MKNKIKFPSYRIQDPLLQSADEDDPILSFTSDEIETRAAGASEGMDEGEGQEKEGSKGGYTASNKKLGF